MIQFEAQKLTKFCAVDEEEQDVARVYHVDPIFQVKLIIKKTHPIFSRGGVPIVQRRV